MKTNIALFIATLAIVMFAIAANANTTGTGKDTTKVAKVYTINDLNGDSIKFKRDDSIRVWVKQPVKDSVETGRTWTNPKTGKKEIELSVGGKTFWMQPGYKTIRDVSDSTVQITGIAGDSTLPSTDGPLAWILICSFALTAGLLVMYMRKSRVRYCIS